MNTIRRQLAESTDLQSCFFTYYLDVWLYRSLLFKLPLTQIIMLILVMRQRCKFSITKMTTKLDLIFILDLKYSSNVIRKAQNELFTKRSEVMNS